MVPHIILGLVIILGGVLIFFRGRAFLVGSCTVVGGLLLLPPRVWALRLSTGLLIVLLVLIGRELYVMRRKR